MKDVSSFFKALSDEARLAMLWLLMNRRELCVCDFIETLGITQSKASRHLRNLLRAGLVTDRRAGPWSYYSLRPVEDEFVRLHLEALRRSLAKRRDAKALLEALRDWSRRKAKEGGCE